MANSRIVNTPSQAIPQDGTTHRQRTVSSSALDVVNWTLNGNTQHVFVQFTGADCRVTFDGATDPTASLGFVYYAGAVAYWPRAMALKAKAIRAGSTDCVIEAQELNFI
jgi:hypothetical protein